MISGISALDDDDGETAGRRDNNDMSILTYNKQIYTDSCGQGQWNNTAIKLFIMTPTPGSRHVLN